MSADQKPGSVIPLRFRSARSIVNPSRDESAASDLHRYAEMLASMVHVLRPCQHAAALRWTCDWRMYCFEQNLERWPDGKFYLLDRGYQFWRGHRIAFTREELTAIGCDEWDRVAISVGHDKQFVPMDADCFHRSPGRQLRRYAELVGRLRDAFYARIDAGKARP